MERRESKKDISRKTILLKENPMKDKEKQNENLIQAKGLKGELFKTDILDTFEDAKLDKRPIYSNSKRAVYIYLISVKYRRYILKVSNMEAGDYAGARQLRNDHEAMRQLGDEIPFFARQIDFQFKTLDSGRISAETLMKFSGKTLLELMPSISNDDLIKCMIQSLIALRYAETRKASHIEIKPSNIVYMDGLAKIMDLSCTIRFSAMSGTLKGVKNKLRLLGYSKTYAPPEVLKEATQKNAERSKLNGNKVDVYYWGMTFYQLITKKPSKELSKIRDAHIGISKEDYETFLTEVKNNKSLLDMDPKGIVADIITKCLQYKAEDRPTFEGAYKMISEIESRTYSEDNGLADLYFKMGFAYRNYLSNNKAALEHYEKALKIYLKLFGENNIDTADTYNNMGLVYTSMEDNKSALNYYDKALNIRLKLIGECNAKTSDSYFNMGLAHGSKGDNKASLNYHEKALNIRKKVLSENHVDTSDSFFSVGAVYYEMGDFKSALTYHEKSLAIRVKLLGESHKKTADSYFNVGLVYGNLKEFKEALSNHEKSLNLRKKLIGEDDIATADSYFNVGFSFTGVKDYMAALRNYEKALTIFLKVYGAEHNKTADTYNNMGLLYKSINDYGASLTTHEKALNIRLKVLGEDDISTARSYKNIGNIYYYMSNFKAAMNYYKLALGISSKLLGDDDEITIRYQRDYEKATSKL